MKTNKLLVEIVMMFLLLSSIAIAADISDGDIIKIKYVYDKSGNGVENASINIYSTVAQEACDAYLAGSCDIYIGDCCVNTTCTKTTPSYTWDTGLYATAAGNLIYQNPGRCECYVDLGFTTIKIFNATWDQNDACYSNGGIDSTKDKIWVDVNGQYVVPTPLGNNITDPVLWDTLYSTTENAYTIFNITLRDLFPGNLSITKVDNPDPVENGTQLNYTITINNTGDYTAYNSTITETYSANTSYVSASPSPTTGNNIWNLGNLTPGQIVEINITVNVNGTVENGTIITNKLDAQWENETISTYSITIYETTTVIADKIPVITPLGCTPDPANISNSVTCYANVTDDYGVDIVSASVTHVNTTIIPQSVICSGPSLNRACEFTFTATTLPGNYNINWQANDTINRIGLNTDSFTVFDVNSMSIVSTGCVPDPSNISDSIICSATVTDDVAVDAVTANVNHVNSSVLVQSVGCSGPVNNRNCNFTFTQTTLPGTYNVTWFANDTSNNLANDTDNFLVQDLTDPVIALGDCQPDPANISNSVVCTATITDNIGVGTVIANVTHPNSTVLVQAINCGGPADNRNCNFTFTSTTYPGAYNVNWLATDTSNNVDTAVDNFNVQDVTAPTITIGDCQPDPANISDSVTCNVTITDIIGIGTVQANVTHVNTSELVQLVNCVGGATSQICEFTFTQTTLPGNYNIDWSANDTSGNLDTNTDSFTIFDVNSMNIGSTGCIPDPANILNSVICTADVLDDVAIHTVLANVTHVNSSVYVQSISCSTGIQSKTCNFTFTTTTLPGQYNVSWFANDTSGNSATDTENFLVQDVTDPVITLGDCQPDPANISNSVICNATITDNIGIGNVYANVTHPDSSVFVQIINCAGTNTNKICNFTFTQTTQPGNYNVVWRATDTSNNDDTDNDNFNVQDVTDPVITLGDCQPDPANISNSVTCNATITDIIGIGNVQANVTHVNTSELVQLVNCVGGATSQICEFTFTQTTNPGTYNVLWLVNDTSNNENTNNDNFNVVDLGGLIVNATGCVPSPSYLNSTITCTADIIDNVEVGTGWATINHVNGSLLIPNVSCAGSLTTVNCNFNTNQTQDIGTYNVTWYGNDTSSNTANDTDNFLIDLCGNNLVDPGEQCDGTNITPTNCVDFSSAYIGGTLACTSSCIISTAGCKIPSGGAGGGTGGTGGSRLSICAEEWNCSSWDVPSCTTNVPLDSVMDRYDILDNKKIAICHNPGTSSENTLIVSTNSLKAHEGHGDFIGVCPSITNITIIEDETILTGINKRTCWDVNNCDDEYIKNINYVYVERSQKPKDIDFCKAEIELITVEPVGIRLEFAQPQFKLWWAWLVLAIIVTYVFTSDVIEEKLREAMLFAAYKRKQMAYKRKLKKRMAAVKKQIKKQKKPKSKVGGLIDKLKMSYR